MLVQASRTASLIACTSPKCECGSPRCGCAAQQCTYSRSYAEQSSSSGILVEDLLALHDGELLLLRAHSCVLAHVHCGSGCGPRWVAAFCSLRALACPDAGQPGAAIIFGCETQETGEIYQQRADGLLGLGNSDASGGGDGQGMLQLALGATGSPTMPTLCPSPICPRQS